jgi:putative transposase
VQQIRNLLMNLGNSAASFRFLVRDRAGQLAEAFRRGACRGRYRGGESRPAARRRTLMRKGSCSPPRSDHPVADLSRKQVKRRPVLGGLINEYERAA